MPKLFETTAQRKERLDRRYGNYTCSFCKTVFPAYREDGKPVGKTKYLKPNLKVTVGSFVMEFKNVCYECMYDIMREVKERTYKLIKD